MHHQGPQAICCYTQQTYGYIVPVVAAHYAVSTPIQDTHYIQAWLKPTYCRVTVQEQPYRKQRLGNHWCECECKCYEHISKYTSMYIHRDIQVTIQVDAHLQKLSSYIIQDWPYRKDELEHDLSKLAMIDGIAMKGKRIMIPFSIAETNSTAVAQQSQRHREDEAPST